MAVPPFTDFFRPILEVLADGAELTAQDIEKLLGERMNLSLEDRTELLPSGLRSRFRDRIVWAITYLVQAGVLERPRRGYCRITERGSEFIKSAPPKLTQESLEVFPEFLEFKARSQPKGVKGEPMTGRSVPADEGTPQDRIESAHLEITGQLASDLLARLKAVSPAYFEKIIVDLMLRLGYGGLHENAGETLGRSGDEGVDGVIRQDKLGLDAIYLQAKRWDSSTVGRREIQAFVGALTGQGANKGVFITTSTFSKEAQQYVRQVQNYKISLIDGHELARLMMEHDLGVSTVAAYHVKRVDSDYFEDTE